MQTSVKQLVTQMDDAYKLFLLALELGEKIRQTTEVADITKLMDDRWRLCNRTHKAMLAIKLQLLEAQASPAITASEKAFLNEKRRLLRDLSPRFTVQSNELRRYMAKKLETLRSEKVSLRRNTHAIKQYISAPGSKTWIR